jgi:hypothetical protein
LNIGDSSHATHECGHERQFFTANASITAQIIVMPGRHRFSASGFLHHVADQNSGRQFKSDPIVKNKTIASAGISKFWQTPSRALVRSHRWISLLGSIETEQQPALNRSRKKPRPRPGLLVR